MNGPLRAVLVVATLSSDERTSVRGPCGRSWVALRPHWAVLGRSWDLSGRSWAASGASVGGPGLPLGPLRSVLGSSRTLCGRSWAAPGASVVGPRPLLAAKWPFLEREGLSGQGPRGAGS